MGFTQKENYQAWLRRELLIRGWNISDLARAAHRSHTAISNQISGLNPPNFDICQSIATAFHLPETIVLRKAGLLSEDGNSELEIELNYKISLLTKPNQQFVLDLVNGMLIRQEKEKHQT